MDAIDLQSVNCFWSVELICRRSTIVEVILIYCILSADVLQQTAQINNSCMSFVTDSLESVHLL